MFVPRYSAVEARAAIEASANLTEALRLLGLCTTGGNWKTLAKWAAHWQISTSHLDPDLARHRALRQPIKALDDILVAGSRYSRHSLKQRMYSSGPKRHECEICGQSEIWNGQRMALILDHINGVRDDNPLPI